MRIRNRSAEQAFAALRQVSQHANVKLHDVAAVAVATGTTAEPSGIDDETTRLVLTQIRLGILGAGFGI